MSYVIENYYHIKGEPDVIEVANTPEYYSGQNYLRAVLRYDLGGNAIVSIGEVFPRGYYIMVYPVGYKKEKWGGYTYATKLFANDGYSKCVVPCGRKSKKREEEAREIFENNITAIIKNRWPELDVELIPEER